MDDLYDPTGDADRAAYSALVNLKEQAIALAADVNREAATLKGVGRAGAGGRPDANAENAINQSVGGLGLTQQESDFSAAFVQNQGGGWKEQREALSAIWAKRTGLFQNLTPGKQQGGPDIEYRTTDAGEPRYWDQKTMYTGHEGFDGRLMETHGKATDQNGRGVGLLLDSTFESPHNYEKNWLGINMLILSGQLPPEAVKEVHAPNPAALRSEIHVVMTQQYPNGVEKNVKWAEGKSNGQQGNFLQIPAQQLGATNYQAVKAGQENSWSRYSNNRQWLPAGVYHEYPVKCAQLSEGSCRFVMSEDRATVYLSVTHYKGYSVQPAQGAMQVRNPFYLVA